MVSTPGCQPGDPGSNPGDRTKKATHSFLNEYFLVQVQILVTALKQFDPYEIKISNPNNNSNFWMIKIKTFFVKKFCEIGILVTVRVFHILIFL